MHTPGPWRAVMIDDGEYYTRQIEITGGHIASAVGWSSHGKVCPVTAANARLIEHAPDLADALQQLLDWADRVGGWEAVCWDRARRVLAYATDREEGA